MSFIPNFTRFTTTSGVNAELDTKINLTEKGAINGVCPLENGLINPRYYDPSVMEFKGVWDALINNPLLSDGGLHNLGQMYIVSVGGTQFTPAIDFVAGDFVVYDGAKWKRVNANSIVLNASNVTATGGTLITGTDVQSQLGQIDGAFVNQNTYNNDFNTAINTNATNLNNHLNSTTAHTDINLVNTNGTRNYATGANMKVSVDNLDTKVKSNSDNITTNTTNLNNHLNNFINAHQANSITTDTNGTVINIADVQTNLNQLDGGVSVNNSLITNHINSTTAHEAQHITTNTTGLYITASDVQTNFTDIDFVLYTARLENFNLLENCCVWLMKYITQLPFPAITFNSYKSMIYPNNIGTVLDWDVLVTLKPRLNVHLIESTNLNKQFIFCIKLTGSGWTGTATENLFIGFMNQYASMSTDWANVSNLNTALIGIYDASNSGRKMRMCRFNTTGGLEVSSGSATAPAPIATNMIMTPSFPSPYTYQQNDVITVFYDTNYDMSCEVRRNNVIIAKGLYTGDSKAGYNSLISTNVFPCFSSFSKGPTFEITVLNQREMESLFYVPSITGQRNIFN